MNWPPARGYEMEYIQGQIEECDRILKMATKRRDHWLGLRAEKEISDSSCHPSDPDIA